MKKLIAAILAVAMICTFGGFAVFADEAPAINIGVPQTGGLPQNLIDDLSALEFNNVNVHYALHKLGVVEAMDQYSIWGEDENGYPYTLDELNEDMTMAALENLGIYDMPALIDMAENILAYTPQVMSVLPTNSPQNGYSLDISFTAGGSTRADSYSVKVGEENRSFVTWTNGNDVQDIQIIPKSGYKISSILITTLDSETKDPTPAIAEATASPAHEHLRVFKDLCQYTKYDTDIKQSDGSAKITAATLKKGFDANAGLNVNDLVFSVNYSPGSTGGAFGSGKTPDSGVLNFEIYTDPITPGNVTKAKSITNAETNDEPVGVVNLFTYGGNNYNSLETLVAAINNDITHGDLTVGRLVNISYNRDYIVAAASKTESQINGEQASTNGSFSFVVSDKETEIAVLYKKTVTTDSYSITDGLSDAKVGDAFFTEYVNSVNIATTAGNVDVTSFDDLKTKLSELYQGTPVTLTFDLKGDYVINAATETNAIPVTLTGGNIVKFTLPQDMFTSLTYSESWNYSGTSAKNISLTLTMKAAAPQLTHTETAISKSETTGTNSGAKENGKGIVFYVDNMQYLPETFSGSMTLNGTVVTTNNSVKPQIETVTTQIDSNNYYYGVWFNPKGDDFNFNYTIGVDASLRYSGGTVTDYGTLSIGAAE